MYFYQISGLACGHDCGVPDVAAVNMMRGFLHDHRGKQTDRLPHTLSGRSALEFILSNDVAVPEKVSLKNEQSSAMVHSCQQASWTACQRSFAGLQQGCKAMVRQWYFLTRTRWSNGPRSRLADPESGGVPDVDSQQGAARAAICRIQINILPLISYRLRVWSLVRCALGATPETPTPQVALRCEWQGEKVARTVVKRVGW
jgi:hypothetical protein